MLKQIRRIEVIRYSLRTAADAGSDAARVDELLAVAAEVSLAFEPEELPRVPEREERIGFRPRLRKLLRLPDAK